MLGRALFVVATVALVSMAPDANATSDSGQVARLLAFAGPHERFALISEESIQGEGCRYDACTVYALDLEKNAYARLLVRELDPDDTSPSTPQVVTARYLRALGAEAKALAPLGRHADQVPPLPVAPNLDTEGFDELFVADGEHRLEVRLEPRRKLRGAAPWDALSGQPCDEHQPPPCSTCAWTDVTLNDAPAKLWSCGAGAGTRPDGTACDCSAEAKVVAAELFEGKRLRSAGQEVLASPDRLSQNRISGPGTPPTSYLALPHHDFAAYRSTAGALVVVGAAAHAPMLNGTFFPLAVAWNGARTEEQPAPLPPVATNDRGVEVVPSPPAAPATGCASCHIGRERPRPALAGILAALALALGTRRAISRGVGRSAEGAGALRRGCASRADRCPGCGRPTGRGAGWRSRRG